MRIKKLDIYIAKQFLLLFAGTFFICQFVLMMQFLWRYVDEVIGKGLSLTVLGQFFWYMGLGLVPQALPLAILLSSLITFGNLGENSELTAIKAAGISLMQAFRSLIFISCIATLGSFYFQNVIAPAANRSMTLLLISMKQTNPELEIPEGVFYDGIPNTNIYVQRKDLKTGMLYGLMIYKMNNSYDDATVVLADSGRMLTTAEKKHLKLHLYSGELFENLKSGMTAAAMIPYQRETFAQKDLLIDFDSDFNLADASIFSDQPNAKSLTKIMHDIDSIRYQSDSIGRAFYALAKRTTYYIPSIDKKDSVKAVKEGLSGKEKYDTLFAHLSVNEKRQAVQRAVNQSQSAGLDAEMKSDITKSIDRNVRRHQLEAMNKFTLSLSCLIFFFIGAPLGAIIRKGGLGVPVIVSVLVFIVFYILDNTGSKMARDGHWNVYFGKLLGTFVLAPLAAFFTYKANNDSTVFNIDAYREVFRKMFGLRLKRHVASKEVIINDPQYEHDAERLVVINADIEAYEHEHNLLKLPNPIKVFFREGDDQRIREINDELEEVIEDLSNTRDKAVLTYLNRYPVMATHAHTRPFRRKWLNIVTGLLLPIGIFFYCRMIRFRFRLFRDLKQVEKTNGQMISRIEEMTGKTIESQNQKEETETENG